MPDGTVKFPTGLSNSRLYGRSVKLNALGLPGGGGLIAVGFDSYITLNVIFLGDFAFVRIFLKNYRVTMTTTLDTSCSENRMVLSARRGFLHACIF